MSLFKSKEPAFTLPKSAIIVDDDAVILGFTQKILEAAGVEKIDVFSNGADAWKAFNQYKYELVVLDWKLPGLSGLTLFNRIKRIKEHEHTPVLVISGFLKKDDFKIVSEFSGTVLLEKPFTRPKLENAFTEVVKSANWAKENAETMENLFAEISYDVASGMRELQKIIADSPNPLMPLVDAARALRKARHLKEAEALLRKALNISAQSVHALTELGKVMHLQRRHQEAARLLVAANTLTPSNIERLLLLGEVHLTQLNPDVAREYFQQALEVDAEDPKALHGVVTSNNLESYLETHDLESIPHSMASMLNIVGISMVRSGNIENGIAQYRAALSFIGEAAPLARIYFNLGLAHLRQNKSEQAKKWFEKSAVEGGQEFSKAKAYIQHLNDKAHAASERAMDVATAQAMATVAPVIPTAVAPVAPMPPAAPVASAPPTEIVASAGSEGEKMSNKVEYMEEAVFSQDENSAGVEIPDEQETVTADQSVSYI